MSILSLVEVFVLGGRMVKIALKGRLRGKTVKV